MAFGGALAAEQESNNWGEWTYLMEGKPTDSWYDTAKREITYFYKLLTDTKFSEFVGKMKSGDSITAYAIATGKPLEGMTEEQKKAIACSDPIYAAGADECKAISAENPKNELGAPPTATTAADGSVTGLDGDEFEAVYKNLSVGNYDLSNPNFVKVFGDDYVMMFAAKPGADFNKTPMQVVLDLIGDSKYKVKVNIWIKGPEIDLLGDSRPNELISKYEGKKLIHSENNGHDVYVLPLEGLHKQIKDTIATYGTTGAEGLSLDIDDNRADSRESIGLGMGVNFAKRLGII